MIGAQYQGLTYWGGTGGGDDDLPTPAMRIYAILFDNRTLAIAADARILAVPADAREMSIE